jgi:serine phosphatase RsbU (regulator of sigma subunit)
MAVTLSRQGTFATAIVTTFFAPSRRLMICNAGHPRPLLYRAATKQWELLTHEESERPIKAATNSPGTGSLGLHNLSRSYHG